MSSFTWTWKGCQVQHPLKKSTKIGSGWKKFFHFIRLKKATIFFPRHKSEIPTRTSKSDCTPVKNLCFTYSVSYNQVLGVGFSLVENKTVLKLLYLYLFVMCIIFLFSVIRAMHYNHDDHVHLVIVLCNNSCVCEKKICNKYIIF